MKFQSTNLSGSTYAGTSRSTPEGLDLSPEWSLEEVVNRYPTSLQFFHTKGLPGEPSRKQLRMTVRDFAGFHEMTLEQLESELGDHLKRAVRPDEECEMNICYLLLFCPTKFKDVLIRKMKHWIPFVKEDKR